MNFFVTVTLGVLLVTGSAVAAPKKPAPAAEPKALPANAEKLSHGRFRDLIVYKPPQAPRSFALMISGLDGVNAAAEDMAQSLVRQGAMVAAIDYPAFRANLEADESQCVFPDGDLENLSHFVQAYFHNPSYLVPILVGVEAGAALSYATLVQAPKDTFASLLTVNFCPDMNLSKPVCKGSGLEFTPKAPGVLLHAATAIDNPWVNLEAGAQACAVESKEFLSRVRGSAHASLPAMGTAPLTAAYGRLAARDIAEHVPAAPAALGDLPVVEVPAVSGSPSSDAFAILMSGDGGWAGIDESIAAALAKEGIPVVGLDSLRYYWTARTPDGVAADTDKLIRFYIDRLKKQRVLLIGYSQGADVLPFAVNRLPPATRAKVALTAILGMSEHALFEFHLSSWVSDDSSGPATLPEVNRITGTPVLCIYGQDENDSLCPRLDAKRFKVVKVKGGHHFDGDYAGLAREILVASRP